MSEDNGSIQDQKENIVKYKSPSPVNNNEGVTPDSKSASNCNANNENKSQQKIIISNNFEITVSDLENLMSKYKERGSNFADIAYFEHEKGTERWLGQWKTDPKTGIASTDFRENDFGSNKVFVEPVPHFCAYVWESLEDLMIRILIVAALVQIILGVTWSDDPARDWVDGVSIIIAVWVVTWVGSITNWSKETKFHELNEIQNEGTKYTVFRKGVPVDIISDDLLVGDLIQVNYGDIVPADLLLVEGNGVKMDESSWTGESDAMKKENFDKCWEAKNRKEAKPPSMLWLSGTNCIEGNGKAIVLAVGDHSQKGIIKRTVDNAQENSQTPLEIKLDSIAKSIGWFGMIAGWVTFIALFIRFGVSYSEDNKTYNTNKKFQALISGYAQNFPNEWTNPTIETEAKWQLTSPKDWIAKKILDIIWWCVSIIVVAIPEGLPLAVTLSWAFSIKKLMDQNNLVRKMHACETMGGANYICTDKTGTLTKNEMNVFKILNAKADFELTEENVELNKNIGMVENGTNAPLKKIREDPRKYFPNENYWNLIRTAVALNIEGSIKKFDVPNVDGDTEVCETKNKTDNAFIELMYRLRAPISVEREKYLVDDKDFKQFPFDSKRKRMTSFIKNESFPTGYRLFSKGGAENVKKYCKYYLDPDTGEKHAMSDNHINFISDKIEFFNKNMLRSLYICYKDITKDEFDHCDEVNDHTNWLIDQYDWVFISVFGIRDCLRDGVKESVLKCKEASVNVIMVTGDNIVTAVAIAKDCNIWGSEVDMNNYSPTEIEDDPEQTNDPNKREEHWKRLVINKPRALTGNSFYHAIGGWICKTCGKDTNDCHCPKTEAESVQIAEKTNSPKLPIKQDSIKDMNTFLALTSRLNVMARSQPIHKYALVLGLKSLNHVVAVTGDGTNDAPALSKSDVGFAMFAGTDIAKEASDIVIIDNNFSSIVVAIIYGRNIYDNIRKFLQFQLTVNFCACFLVFICACIGNETPWTPIQMLWVNLIMDSLGSLALATEPPYNDLLKREPTRRKESIINGKMWKHIALQSFTQLIILLMLYLFAPNFMKEQNVIRLAENEIIKSCYGILPGDVSDVNYIIYGTSPKWQSSVRLQSGSNEFRCGKYAHRQDLSLAYKEYESANGSSVHMTIIFNVFVFYTLFNQINARVIDDSFNIFIRMTHNLMFPIITLLEGALQVVIIFIGNAGFHVTEKGWTGEQWGICIGFSAITFILSALAKLIPWDIPLQLWLDNMNGLAPFSQGENQKEIELKHRNVLEGNMCNDNSSENKKILSNTNKKEGITVGENKIEKNRSSRKLAKRMSSFRAKKPEINI